MAYMCQTSALKRLESRFDIGHRFTGALLMMNYMTRTMLKASNITSTKVMPSHQSDKMNHLNTPYEIKTHDATEISVIQQSKPVWNKCYWTQITKMLHHKILKADSEIYMYIPSLALLYFYSTSKLSFTSSHSTLICNTSEGTGARLDPVEMPMAP